MSYIEANKNTKQRTVIQMYRLQHAQANKSCDYYDDFYRAGLDYWKYMTIFVNGMCMLKLL
jgi:hypothetical protein